MVLTVADIRDTLAGQFKVKVVDVTFDDSYATGGEVFGADDAGFRELLAVVVEQPPEGYVVAYDRANSKFMAFEAGADGAALDEVAGSTDLSAVSFRAVCFGQ